MSLVLITGASSGIGAATARRFASGGATVILTARGADALRTLADEIGARAVALPADAADADAVARLAGQVLETHGVPDVIVHCAGAGQWKTVPDTTPDEARRMMGAPYFAAFNVTQAFLPAMLARRSGVIISVNSPAGFIAWPSSVGYTAARAALRGFHEALAQDLVGTGVSACHAVFGDVSSDYWDNNPGARDKLPMLARLLPVMSPEDCAAVITRLARVPRHTAIHPLLLRPLLWSGAVVPPLARRLARL